jgi:predicted nucleic acid-binding protein
MIVLDTSILVYAVGEDDPLREPCRRVIAAHGAGAIDAAVTIDVIAEFAHVRARRRPRADAVALARGYRTALPIVETTGSDLDHALELFQSHPGLNMLDAVLAAVAIANGAEALISADHGFAGIPRLNWVDPASSDLDVLLSGSLGGEPSG